jgi:hypothetical protein
MTARPQPRLADRLRQRGHEPARVGNLCQQRAARVGNHAVSVRHHVYRDLAPSVHHLQGEPPRSALRASATPKNPCQGGQSSGPDHRGRSCFTKDPG